MKIVLSAFACEPNQGSEPGVGWSVAANLAVHHQVHVLTSSKHQFGVEAYLSRYPNPNLSFSYFDPSWSRFLNNPTSFAWNFYYAWWQMRIGAWAKDALDLFNPDVIHHVTYVRYWMYSSLAFRAEPFIFGPVGGGERTPQPLAHTYSTKARLSERLRVTVQSAFTLHPGLKKSLRLADIVLSTTHETEAKVKSLGASNVEILGESALSSGDLELLKTTGEKAEDFFVVSARLLHWKGIHLTLAAFARFSEDMPRFRLEIFGDGPEKDQLQALAFSLGLAEHVVWHGSVPRQTYLDRLRSSRALVHASLHDSGGWVCVEAMAAGVPVICLNTGGPATQITSDTGIVVPATTPEETIQNLCRAMVKLSNNEDLPNRFGRAGRKRVEEHYTWSSRVAYFTNLYDRAIQLHQASKTPPPA